MYERVCVSHAGKYVLNQDDNMKRLEAIVHPLVHAERERFLAQVCVPPKLHASSETDATTLSWHAP